ncbi:hypothetical protein DRQ21_06960 [Candidatus Fermentibacteria bacterium]|nr:MAG: hypothetical protein DRQ21_06960 [Candidatus Fermentibacteria bacterium]
MPGKDNFCTKGEIQEIGRTPLWKKNTSIHDTEKSEQQIKSGKRHALIQRPFCDEYPISAPVSSGIRGSAETAGKSYIIL